MTAAAANAQTGKKQADKAKETQKKGEKSKKDQGGKAKAPAKKQTKRAAENAE